MVTQFTPYAGPGNVQSKSPVPASHILRLASSEQEMIHCSPEIALFPSGNIAGGLYLEKYVIEAIAWSICR
jgi:hypothetical protein